MISGPARYSLSRKEGWRTFCDTPARVAPDQLTPRQLSGLGEQARADYDDDRHLWHANFGVLGTPALRAAHAQLDQVVAANLQDADRLRGAAVIDALPGLGKTTIANTYARSYDRNARRRHGELTESGHERIPVFRVGLTSNTTLRTLNQMICQFYGHPGAHRGTAATLADYAVDCVLACDTGLGIIDDIHFINPNRRDGHEVSNHLKWLVNELPVTFIYVGVGLAERRFFREGLTGSDAVLAQTARRWTRCPVDPFTAVDRHGTRAWAELLASTEDRLVLARARPRMLLDMADYLFRRTGGHIGSFVTLIVRGCYQAIRTGTEQLTVDLLNAVRIDEAAEHARARTASRPARARPTRRALAAVP